MLASSLEAVLCETSWVMSTQLLPAKTEVCVWVLASSVIHWHLTYPELPRTREKPGIWHNVVTFSELMFQNTGSSILVLRKGPRILGSVIFSNLVGGWAPAQRNCTSWEQECQGLPLHLSLLHSWPHSQELLSESSPCQEDEKQRAGSRRGILWHGLQPFIFERILPAIYVSLS